jgi:hypothetical protein
MSAQAVLERAAEHLLSGVPMLDPDAQRPRDDVVAPLTRRTWAALAPCSDEQAAMPPPCLLMTESELSIVAAHGEALQKARKAVTAAEQALAKGEAAARLLPGLLARAGAIAAAGFSGEAVDVDVAKHHAQELEQARNAEAAVPVLKSALESAKVQADRAYGGLRVNLKASMANARHRAASRYAELVSELVGVVAHLNAGIELSGGQTMSAAWNCYTMPALAVPALPIGIRPGHDGIEELSFKPMLLAPGHGRLTAQTVAARGWFVQQVEAASGMPATRILG